MILATLIADNPELVVVDFWEERDSDPHFLNDLEHVVTFGYPEFHTLCLDINIRTDPSPSYQPNSTPFLQDTSHVLFVVSFSMDNYSARQYLIQFLPSSSLTSFLKNENKSYYEWKKWGPHGSRLLFSSPYSRNYFVNGWKYATLEDDTSHDGFVARLYDFNQVAIKRNYKDTMDEGTCTNGNSWVYQRAGTTVIPGLSKFLAKTTLPYRSRVLPLEDVHERCLVHCAEDQLIILDASLWKKNFSECCMLTDILTAWR